jgi:hypothetical protein
MDENGLYDQGFDVSSAAGDSFRQVILETDQQALHSMELINRRTSEILRLMLVIVCLFGAAGWLGLIHMYLIKNMG